MISAFFRSFFELPAKKTNIVCLGGGIGTSQVLKGLRTYPYNLTAIISMADDGGSAGRLRRAFQILPPGDLINCIAALSDEENILRDLLLYRFSGDRYGKDTDIGGQKLGNLVFLALSDIYKGDVNKALVEMSKIVSSKGTVLPATVEDVNIWAMTKEGSKVYGEENIDLGKYIGKSHTLSELHLNPADVKAYKPAIKSLKEADVIIACPGDLFSAVLPVLIVPEIKSELKKTKAKKVYILNIANKPFETPNYKASDYLSVVKKHIGADVWDKILINNNHGPKIPKDINYSYVQNDFNESDDYKNKVLEADYLNVNYPIYHDTEKIAKIISSI